MELDINPDPQDLNGKSGKHGRKPWQYACIVIAVCIAVAFTLFTDMNNSMTGMICAILVAPLGYAGFFNKNGLDYFEYRRKKKESRQGNSIFLYETERYTKPVFVFEKKNVRKRDNRGIFKYLNSFRRRGGNNG